MNAPLHPEVLHRRESSPQVELPLSADGVRRHLWESRFGPILIEVRQGRSYVNGQLVEPITREPRKPAQVSTPKF